MEICNLSTGCGVYTSNVYLITGTWNAIEDINTLIDVGRDPAVIEKINVASTGIGKKRIEQVALTHSHYDHASLLPVIREEYSPKVYAFSRSLDGVDCLLKDGDILKMGDREFEVIYSPGHSNDSICLFCEEDKVLFVGDSPVVGLEDSGSHESGFVKALEKICRRDVRSIYYGHGNPLFDHCNRRIRESLKKARKAAKKVSENVC